MTYVTSPEKTWRSLTAAERYQRAKERWYYQMLRIDQEDIPLLKELAKKKGISLAELIRTYITWGLENDAPRRR